MQIVRYESRDQWLEIRATGIGASEAAEALGIVPSPLALYNRKLGLEPKGPVTIPQRVGLALEPTILDLYREETGREIVETQTLARSATHPFILATLDAIDSAGDLVECKTITVRNLRELGDEDLEQLPERWVVQAHQQMIVAERDLVNFAVLIGNEEFRLYPIRRNPSLCDYIVKAESELWRRILERRPPPAMDEDDYQTVARAYASIDKGVDMPPGVLSKVRRAYVLGKLAAMAEKERDALRAEIQEAVGTAGLAVSPSGWAVERKMVHRKGYVVEPLSYTTMTIKPPKECKNVGDTLAAISQSLAHGDQDQAAIGQGADQRTPADGVQDVRR